ncbi:MAG TPA: hypothetical protein VFB50_22435 [Chloroflexota bacterium]|nr:hypothetical protein [Chloroflexota bacterium]
MVRTNSVNFTGANQYPMASAGTDIFKKEDVQVLAKSVDLHDHSSGLGLAINPAGIAAGSIDGSKLIDGTVTSAKIQDGTIATADLASASVTNVKLASDTARANLLVNGGFEVWQRGNGPFTTTAAYAADRWQVAINSGGLSVSRDTSTIDVGSQASCAFTETYAGTLNRLTQLLNDVAPQLAGRTITVSARTRCTAPNALRLNVYADTSSGGGSGSVSATSATDPGTGAWSTLSATLAIPAGANYLTVRFEFIAGASGNLDNAMLAVGSQAADYAPLHPADDLARCLRYYELLGGNGGGGGSIGVEGIATAASQEAAQSLGFRAIKAVSPTVTKVGTWTVSNTGQPAVSGGDAYGVRFTVQSIAAGVFYAINTVAGQYITVEANP